MALIGLMVSMMPKGFKMTHEEIGTGKPAIVFIYDANLEVSNLQSEQMNKARDQINDKVFFLIAKNNTLDGDKLIKEHHARRAELLLFDPSGKLVKRQLALKDSSELIQWIMGDSKYSDSTHFGWL